MTYAQVIIEQQGGTRQFARLLKCPPSTVQAWKRKGVFPVGRIPEIGKVTGIPKFELIKACVPHVPSRRPSRKEAAHV